MISKNTIRYGSAIVIAGVVACGAIAQSSDKIPEIIQKVISASKKLSYSGSRTVLLKFGPDQHRHVEFVTKNGPRTRIEFPEEGTYRGQIIVETENERRHYFPNENQIDVMPPRRDEFVGRWLKMGNRGSESQFKIEDGPPIAGFATKVVQVGSPSGFVFQKLWIDPRTGLVLKREFYGRDGGVQASSEFTKVDYQPKFNRSDFVLNIPGAKIITPWDRLAKLVGKGGFKNVSLSPKDPFRLESSRIQRIGNSTALVQDYVNKDGRVALIQVNSEIDPDKLRRGGRGEVNTYSWQKGGTYFVLLGNMPEAKLKEMAGKLGG